MAAEHKALYDDPDDLGEKPIDVPGEIVFHFTPDPITDDDSLINELGREGGEAGATARALHGAGKAVAAAKAGAHSMKLYVHDNPEVIIGAASVLVTAVAGGIVFEKIVKPKLHERQRQGRNPQNS